MNIGNQVICPLCRDSVHKLVYRFHIDSEKKVIEKIKNDHPAWTEKDGLCSRCVDYYQTAIIMEQRMLPSIGPFFPVKNADDFIILPTGLRVDADPRYTGKGVTICFVDSGFSRHPDLVQAKNRIKLMLDLTDQDDRDKDSADAAWHGTMTTVVCAGDGYLSRGLYKGVASDADLVLLKVQDSKGRITTNNIIRALEWILENHRAYGIRIVNLSLRDDELVSNRESRVDQLAERLIEKGISIVAAVGNDESGQIYPPANALNVIAVGGIDDQNILGNTQNQAYHSSFGKTLDGLMKPELVAHAIWIAAPILPGSAEQQEAARLHTFYSLADEKLASAMTAKDPDAQWLQTLTSGEDRIAPKESIRKRIQESKYISPHYQHVDGTSFAAPIVSSVIAQLLEIDPELTPFQIRQTLFSTAGRIPGIPAERQGYGRIHPRKAALKVLRKQVIERPFASPVIHLEKKTIEFFLHHDQAEQVSLAGSFNGWAEDLLLMEPAHSGVWRIEIPLLAPGTYHYKFYIDSRNWIEDAANPYREPDGFAGFNSVFEIQKYSN